MSVIAWMIGSSAGRKLVLIGLALAAFALTLLAAFKKGQAAEQSKAQKKTIEALQNRISVDEEVSRLSPDARLERLRSWVNQ